MIYSFDLDLKDVLKDDMGSDCISSWSLLIFLLLRLWHKFELKMLSYDKVWT